VVHGRRIGFESGTAEGVEHEPRRTERPKASRGVRYGKGVSPPQLWCPVVTPGIFLEIYLQIGAFWSANH